MKSILIISLFIFSLIISCSDKNSNPANIAEMTAKTGTISFTAEKVTAVKQGDYLIITGEMEYNSQKIVIALKNPGTGTFKLQPSGDGGNYAYYSSQPGDQQFNSITNAGNCIVTNYSGNYVEGTFYFDAATSVIPIFSMKISEGSFKVNY
ncbi:MAG: hypothetical protein QG635_1802 [Bacteroidota bacterium]|nr:hypothetical protein [Bacteroidota bacterium]